MTTVGIYGDENGSSRVGLRQTNLSSQLESAKKYKNKTKSVMFNAAFSMSKNSLLDSSSMHSHHTNGSAEMLNFMTNGTSNNSSNNTAITNNFYNQHNNGSYHQIPRKSSNQLLNQHSQNNQGYNHNQHQQLNTNHNQGHNNNNSNNIQGYNQNQPYNSNYPHQGYNQHQNQPYNSNYRESYMYLNDTNHERQQQQLPPLNLKRVSGSPNAQHRAFLSHGGIMASPTMSVSNEDYARKLSFNALMGVNMNHSNINSSPSENLMENDDEWESIDEGVIINKNKSISNNNSEEAEKIIQRLTLENRSLKKKLKDIELGHDSNSIVAEDEKYFKLENDYNELLRNYNLIESKTKNLTDQNDSYYKNVESLRLSLSNKDEIISIFTSLTRCIIERLPKYIKQKDNFDSLFTDSIGINEIPEQIKECYLRTLEKFNSKSEKGQSKTVDSNLTDDDIIDMLKFDVKNLYIALLRSQKNSKKIDMIFNKKIQDERKTIIVSSLQPKLHDEFIHENPDKKKIGLKNLRLLNICPAAQNEVNTDIDVVEDKIIAQTPPNSMVTSSFNDSQLKSKLSTNPSLITPKTPITPLSSGTSVDSFSPLMRLSINSNPLDSLNESENDNDPDRFKTLYKENEELEDNFFSTHSSQRISDESLEMEYETFTS